MWHGNLGFRDQVSAGRTVVSFAEIDGSGGWVVVREDRAGSPGRVLGSVYRPDQAHDDLVTVKLKEPVRSGFTARGCRGAQAAGVSRSGPAGPVRRRRPGRPAHTDCAVKAAGAGEPEGADPSRVTCHGRGEPRPTERKDGELVSHRRSFVRGGLSVLAAAGLTLVSIPAWRTSRSRPTTHMPAQQT